MRGLDKTTKFEMFKWRLNFYIDEIKYFPYKVYRSIVNIFYFFPVLWKWRSYDYSFTLQVMRELFFKHYKDIQKYSLHIDKEKEELLLLGQLVETLDRIIKDDYATLAGVQYDDTEFYFEPVEDKEGFSTLEMEFKNGYSKELHDILMEKSRQMHLDDLDKLGQLMRHIEKIWY